MAPKKQVEVVLTEAQQKDVNESSRRKQRAVDTGVSEHAAARVRAGMQCGVLLHRCTAAGLTAC
jgi:hypothetical protein